MSTVSLPPRERELKLDVLANAGEMRRRSPRGSVN